MRASKLFTKTRHNPPCDADSVNAKYLTQAGFIEKMGAGIYNFLPLGLRVLRKVEAIVRQEMNKVDGLEILMPALHPIEYWDATGRNKSMDGILYRSFASGNKEFVFGPSHEEAVTPLLAKYVQSYKDLPTSVYQIQSKFRDEPRAKSGLLRGREFGMKDMYSFHTSEEDLDAYYERVKDAYFAVFERCGLKTYIIEASGGAFSDKFSHEFSLETEAGEDTIMLCKKCNSAQNIEIAVGALAEEFTDEAELEMKEVAIERGFSVTENAKAHSVAEAKILKSVVYEVEGGGLIGVLIRGDLSVNETKLENYLKKKFRAASPELLRSVGLEQGYISPVGLPDGLEISFIADNSIKSVKNFVTGANKFGVDLVNVNVGRDFVVAEFVDLVEIGAGFKCATCGGQLEQIKAVEVGNIFKLGTRFSESCNLNFTDNDGKSKPVVMGCYGIGTTRLVGSIVEAKHDENGIIWPVSVAPYHVQLVLLGKSEEVVTKADELYKKLSDAGIEVLYDDRDESAGVKFKDADLIGTPCRLVVSAKTIEAGCVEWKLRGSAEAEMVKMEELLEKLSNFINS